jgi:hypothetical protein
MTISPKMINKINDSMLEFPEAWLVMSADPGMIAVYNGVLDVHADYNKHTKETSVTVDYSRNKRTFKLHAESYGYIELMGNILGIHSYHFRRV